jgi:hypothetical protein
MGESARWRSKRVLLAIAAVTAVGVAVLVVPPGGPRTLKSFDPDQTAALEVDMWQAYYAKENLRLFRGLVRLTRSQYRYSWLKSLQASFHLARAAATFGNLRSNYEQVLPDLEAAYTISRDWTGSSYDPAALARAELAWWVARRVPAESSPENVGRLIAEVNAMLYGVPPERVREASVLRARAGRLRDEGGVNADWPEVSRLLHESFRKLHQAVQ